MSSPNNGTIRNGLRIELLRRGGKRTLLSAKYGNLIIRVCNAVLNPLVVRGREDRALISDGNFLIQLKESAGTTSPAASGMHPFKVLTAEPLGNPATDWLRFQCRTGSVLFNSFTPVNATGTDGVADPDSSTRTSSNVFTVASGEAAHHVWATFTYSSGWSVDIDNGTTLPDNDGLHWLIATINCSDTTNKVSVVRQWQRGDILLFGRFSVCGPNGQEWWVMPGARES